MKSKITAFCFLALLFGLTLLSMGKPATVFSEKENRYLAQKPALSLSALLDGSYTEAYEAYLSDQFWGRDHWIRLMSESERFLFQKREINGVYLAKDQYLIEAPDRQDFESERATKNVEALSAFVSSQAASLGQSHVQVMIVPSASQILTETLPLFASPYQEQAFLTSVRDGVGEEHFIDVGSLLRSHQEEYIYYRTDHHWTSLGAFYGYQAWAKAASLTPRGLDAFSVQTVSDSFYGTIQAKVNLPMAPDSITIFTPKEMISPDSVTPEDMASPDSTSPMAYTVTYNESEDVRDTFYEWSALDIRDKYRFFLNGNQPIVRISSAVSSQRNLLLIKDSFANCFVPFAANHFGQTVVVDLRYFNGDVPALMDAYSITDVLVLYESSFLATEPSVSRLALW